MPVGATGGDGSEPTGLAGQHSHGPVTGQSGRVERLNAGSHIARKKVDAEPIERKAESDTFSFQNGLLRDPVAEEGAVAQWRRRALDRFPLGTEEVSAAYGQRVCVGSEHL